MSIIDPALEDQVFDEMDAVTDLTVDAPEYEDQNMWDREGWRKLETCAERDTFVKDLAKPMCVFSSLTDPSGEYGSPIIYTEWGHGDSMVPVLRDYRWPTNAELPYELQRNEPDRPCEHWVRA